MDSIFIKNLDPVLQARNWLEARPDERPQLIETTLAQIRTAILFNDRLTLSHAELFDGILLLVIGPKQLQQELGLSANQPLPITVVSPTTDRSKLEQEVFPIWTSSTEVALGLAPVTYPWLFPAATPTETADPTWLTAARDTWFDAIEAGLVEIRQWDTSCPFDLDAQISAALSQLPPLPAAAASLIEEVIAYPEDVSVPRHGGASRLIRADVKTDKCEERRTRILNIIDDSAYPPLVKECVFRWWNRCYSKSIARRHQSDLLLFSPNGTSIIGGVLEGGQVAHAAPNERRELESALGLIAEKCSPWRALRDRLNPSRIAPGQSLAVEGGIIDDMCLLTPSFYAQVRRNMQSQRERSQTVNSGADMFDLALNVHRIVDPPMNRPGFGSGGQPERIDLCRSVSPQSSSRVLFVLSATVWHRSRQSLSPVFYAR